MIFRTTVPASLANLPVRQHVCADEPEASQSCTVCGKDKPLSAFPLRADGSHRRDCRECVKARTVAWKAANRDRVRAWDRQWYAKQRKRGERG